MLNMSKASCWSYVAEESSLEVDVTRNDPESHEFAIGHSPNEHFPMRDIDLDHEISALIHIAIGHGDATEVCAHVLLAAGPQGPLELNAMVVRHPHPPQTTAVRPISRGESKTLTSITSPGAPSGRA